MLLKGAEYWWKTFVRRIFVEVAIRFHTAAETKAVFFVTITEVWAQAPVGVVFGRAPSFDRNFLTIRVARTNKFVHATHP